MKSSLPQGSGLGTSSVLSGALLAVDKGDESHR